MLTAYTRAQCTLASIYVHSYMCQLRLNVKVSLFDFYALSKAQDGRIETWE